MTQWLLKLIGLDPVGKIVDGIATAYRAKLEAKNDADRIAADVTIKTLETALASQNIAAGVVKEGMQHKAFWIPWLLAAVPLSAWFAWGVADSLTNGWLPDVATLPPQLKEYADVVWGNIFYVGGGVAGAQIVARVFKR